MTLGGEAIPRKGFEEEVTSVQGPDWSRGRGGREWSQCSGPGAQTRKGAAGGAEQACFRYTLEVK